MTAVELHQAFSWDCDACGLENFARAITKDITQEEKDEANRAFLGLEEWELVPENVGCEFVTAPERVKCRECGAEFKTEHP